MKRHRTALATLLLIVLAFSQASPAWSRSITASPKPRSPIRHLIVVVGENRSFDNVFATYVPSDPTQKVWNLLSRGIVLSDGTRGPNFASAAQRHAFSPTTFDLSPPSAGPFSTLPQPNTFGGLPVGICILTSVLSPQTPICSDVGLDPTSQGLLSVPGTGQLPFLPDCRYPSDLPNGPYSVVGASKLNNCGPSLLEIRATSYINNTGDPVHRFYQMWQQSDCSVTQITADNPSGCKSDLYPWVAITVGLGGTQAPKIDQDTFQGGVSMGFYNMAQGDWPFFLYLAQNYAINDNYHQPVMGGSGPNSQFLFTGDVYHFTNARGRRAVPPTAQIENPNPRPGTNNFYINDGVGAQDPDSTGVAYTNCSDRTQPGVEPIRAYLDALPYRAFNGGNCAGGAWYLVNNNYPLYNTDGSFISDKETNAFPAGREFSTGPQTLPTIGEALSNRGVSWKYYGAGFNDANKPKPLRDLYCAICNGFQYSTTIMTTPALRANLVDLERFYTDVANDTLPAVSFIKPSSFVDGHPGNSTPPLFEAFVRKIITTLQAKPRVWRESAILITFDEGGGLYDSGYIQPIDFFGDGPRTVMIAVSPFARRGYVDHTYSDHVSILKFIEWNWKLSPLSSRSRDNLPNPIVAHDAPYFPLNSPAIGDLKTLFDFDQKQP